MLCASLPVQLQPMTSRHRPTAFASELRRIVADLEGDRRALVDADVRTLDSAGVRSVDDAEQVKPTSALGTPHHVDVEAAAQKARGHGPTGMVTRRGRRSDSRFANRSRE